MGLLDKPLPTVQPDFAKQAAEEMVRDAHRAFDTLKRIFDDGVSKFWVNTGSVTPQQIVDALGDDATDLVQLHYLLGQFLQTIKPGCLDDTLPHIGTIKRDANGKVIGADKANPAASAAPS